MMAGPAFEGDPTGVYPTQIHLSLTNEASEMMVTWSTMDQPTENQRVFYQPCESQGDQDGDVSPSTTARFVDNGTLHHAQYVHRAVLVDLVPSTQYCYTVGTSSQPALSREFRFKTLPTSQPNTFTSPKFTVSVVVGFVARRPALLLLHAGARSHRPFHRQVYGDFGLTNARSFPALKREAEEGRSDVIVHTGDFAYDMYLDNATFGDS